VILVTAKVALATFCSTNIVLMNFLAVGGLPMILGSPRHRSSSETYVGIARDAYKPVELSAGMESRQRKGEKTGLDV
jgi:hypothetical protein